ncbi:hypothetical protein MBLNU459_g8233t1 [Dothideomycetes sp. NU459]
MEALNKLAGVQDASQHAAATATPFPEPPPIPQDADIESQTTHSITSRPSRASLPINRQPSRRTLNNESLHTPPQHQISRRGTNPHYAASRNSRNSAGGGSDEDELAWGPQHPCFPHPNPHVPLSSPEHAATRIIRIQRDWLVAGDVYPALQNLYPEILAEYIAEDEFRVVVETLNGMLKEAFTPWSSSSWFDAVLGVATGFLWDNTGLTASKRRVGYIEQWIDEWNREAERRGQEARLVGLRRTGFLSLDIQIPDPHIDGPDV